MDYFIIFIIIFTIILILFFNNCISLPILLSFPLLGIFHIFNKNTYKCGGTTSKLRKITDFSKYIIRKGGSLDDDIKKLQDENNKIIEIIFQNDSIKDNKDELKVFLDNFRKSNKYFMLKNSNSILDPKILIQIQQHFKTKLINKLKELEMNSKQEKHIVNNVDNILKSDEIKILNNKNDIKKAISYIISMISLNTSHNALYNYLQEYINYDDYKIYYNRYIYSNDILKQNNILPTTNYSRQKYYLEYIYNYINNTENTKNVELYTKSFKIENIEPIDYINKRSKDGPYITFKNTINAYLYNLYKLYRYNLHKLSELNKQKTLNKIPIDDSTTRKKFTDVLAELTKTTPLKDDTDDLLDKVSESNKEKYDIDTLLRLIDEYLVLCNLIRPVLNTLSDNVYAMKNINTVIDETNQKKYNNIYDEILQDTDIINNIDNIMKESNLDDNLYYYKKSNNTLLTSDYIYLFTNILIHKLKTIIKFMTDDNDDKTNINIIIKNIEEYRNDLSRFKSKNVMNIVQKDTKGKYLQLISNFCDLSNIQNKLKTTQSDIINKLNTDENELDIIFNPSKESSEIYDIAYKRATNTQSETDKEEDYSDYKFDSDETAITSQQTGTQSNTQI